MHRDGEYSICPYCESKMGDCWEWLKDETPQDIECEKCGKEYVGWAEHDVQYISRPKIEVTND